MASLRWSAPARSRLPGARTSELLASLRPAIERARAREEQTLVSVPASIEGVDPCAAVFASRLASDRWFCWEQPDRGFALAALGVAHEATSRGARRLGDVAEEGHAIAR